MVYIFVHKMLCQESIVQINLGKLRQTFFIESLCFCQKYFYIFSQEKVKRYFTNITYQLGYSVINSSTYPNSI